MICRCNIKIINFTNHIVIHQSKKISDSSPGVFQILWRARSTILFSLPRPCGWSCSFIRGCYSRWISLCCDSVTFHDSGTNARKVEQRATIKTMSINNQYSQSSWSGLVFTLENCECSWAMRGVVQQDVAWQKKNLQQVTSACFKTIFLDKKYQQQRGCQFKLSSWNLSLCFLKLM